MRFFRVPFAQDGDKATVPDELDITGVVSYEEGYGGDYELPQEDEDKKNIERAKLNDILHDITTALALWQGGTFPPFITSSMNGGDPFSYPIHSFVRGNGHSGEGVYISLINNNETALSNTDNWRLFMPLRSEWRTGDIKYTDRPDLEEGWVWRNGATIGNPTSGATGRANNDCYDLFVMYWNSRPNSILPIQNSDGSAGTRGVSADADWSANKRMPVTDMRGRSDFGADNMGGVTAAGRLTASVSGGVVGSQLGAFGGAQDHQLDISQMPRHRHRQIRDSQRGAISNTDERFLGNEVALTNIFTDFEGGDLPHNNMPPAIICNVMVKL
jgi:hypothetical protein